jgi:hypothetical protein
MWYRTHTVVKHVAVHRCSRLSSLCDCLHMAIMSLLAMLEECFPAPRSATSCCRRSGLPLAQHRKERNARAALRSEVLLVELDIGCFFAPRGAGGRVRYCVGRLSYVLSTALPDTNRHLSLCVRIGSRRIKPGSRPSPAEARRQKLLLKPSEWKEAWYMTTGTQEQALLGHGVVHVATTAAVAHQGKEHILAHHRDAPASRLRHPTSPDNAPHKTSAAASVGTQGERVFRHTTGPSPCFNLLELWEWNIACDLADWQAGMRKSGRLGKHVRP